MVYSPKKILRNIKLLVKISVKSEELINKNNYYGILIKQLWSVIMHGPSQVLWVIHYGF
jgi:hypothetical protein